TYRQPASRRSRVCGCALTASTSRTSGRRGCVVGEAVAAPIALWAKRYIETLGLALVAIEPGEKALKGKGWNQPGGYFTEAAPAEAFWRQNPRHNLGVVLGPSRVCSLDVDDVPCTRQLLADVLG